MNEATTGTTARQVLGLSTARVLGNRPFVVTSDGIHLSYQDHGAGRPIVFVSAWCTTADVWQYSVLDFTNRGFRCVSFDRRGHGRSDLTPDGYDIDRLADDLGDVLESLDLRDVVLVAWSLGAAEAVRYLARHGSSRVSRLVVLAGALPYMMKDETNPDGVDPVAAAALVASWERDFPRWCDDNSEAFFHSSVFDVHRDVVAWMKRMIVSTPVTVAKRCGLTMATTDLRGSVRELDVPALVVHGDADASIPVHFGRMTAKLLRRGHCVELPGAGHGAFFTHRDRITTEISDWLAESR